MQSESSVIVLISSVTADLGQEQDQRRLTDLLTMKGIKFSCLDGAQDANRDLRNTLFNLSRQRGKYPQVFFEKDGVYTFIGLWAQIELMNENDGLPVAHRGGQSTFTETFASANRN